MVMAATKILHIQKVTGIAGSERYLLTLLPRLDRRKWDITHLVLTEPQNRMEEYTALLEAEGVRTRRVAIRHAIDPVCLLEIYRFIKSERFDLVHTHLLHGDLYGILAARLAGVARIISTRHNDDPFRRSAIIRTTVRAADRYCSRVIAISHFLSGFVLDVEGISADKIATIPYALPPTATRPDGGQRIRRELSIPRDIPLVLTVGRLTEQKGHRYLVDAWRTISGKNPNARLVIVGDGPLREPLTAYAKEMGLPEKIIFTGWRRDVPDFFEAADLYVQPSLWEGFGLVLLEAMLAERSIVASRVSAIPEIVADGETGILVPPRDSYALADAICRLLEDADLRRDMGKAGKQRAEHAFTVQRMVGETEKVYEEVLAEP